MKKRDRNKNRKTSTGRSSMITMGALVASATIGGGFVWPVYAQVPMPGSPYSPVSSVPQMPLRRYDIPAGPLGGALEAFGQTSKVKVQVLSPPVRDLQSQGIQGLYTEEQALQLLLGGTGATYHFIDANTVSVAQSAAPLAIARNDVGKGSIVLPTLSVLGSQGEPKGNYDPKEVSLQKYTRPLVDIPQSIIVMPKQLMQDQGVTSVQTALGNVPGISLAAGEGGAQGNSLSIRGFAARNDFYLDGMNDFGSYYRDPFNLQAIEVLKGPASVLFGRGSTGGVINQVSKTPRLDRFYNGGVTLGTDATRRVTADINQPLDFLGLNNAAFRLNVMGHQQNITSRPVAEFSRYGFAPTLGFGINTPTRITLTYFHESESDTPDYGIPWYFGKPAPVDRANYYGFKQNNFLNTAVDIGTAKFEHDFNPAISIRSQSRYANYYRNVQITEPQLIQPVTQFTPLSDIRINRNQITASSTETYLDNQTDLTAKFNTGMVRHAVVTGFEGGRQTSSPTRYAFTGVPTTSLLNPNYNQTFAGTGRVTSNVHTTANTFGVYALDTMRLGEYVELSGGVRFDIFDAHYEQSVAPRSNFSRLDTMPTYRGAIVYKPKPYASAYFAYGTSFNPSAEALALTAGSADVAPEETESFEFGTKWQLLNQRLLLEGALFKVEKNNARVTDPNNPLLIVLSGNQRVYGFELDATGNITENWQVFGGYVYLSSKVQSSINPLEVGNRLANAPTNNFILWSTYGLPRWNTTLGGGLNYYSSRNATTIPNATSGFINQAPGYVTVQGMIKYQLTRNIALQTNIYNLTNAYYFQDLHPAHVIPGEGTMALFSTIFNF